MEADWGRGGDGGLNWRPLGADAGRNEQANGIRTTQANPRRRVLVGSCHSSTPVELGASTFNPIPMNERTLRLGLSFGCKIGSGCATRGLLVEAKRDWGILALMDHRCDALVAPQAQSSYQKYHNMVDDLESLAFWE